MTIPSWPAQLPRPMRQGFQRGLPDGRLSTKNDGGPPRSRRQFSAAVAPVAMTIDLSIDDRMCFNLFWVEETVGGSLPFWMADPTLTGVSLMDEAGDPLVDDAGNAVVIEDWWLVMFDTQQTPAETAIGVRYRIAFGVTVMPT